MYRLLLIIWILLTLVYGVAKAQDDHFTDSVDRIDSMRVALGNVTYFDGTRLELVLIARDGTKTYIFDADKYSKLDITKDFKPKDHRSELWWVIYCSKNHSKTGDETVYYPYLLTRVTPSQIKK